MGRTIGAVIVARNDFYGGNLIERSSYCINSLLSSLDEVFYVDWNTVLNKTLVDEIKHHIPKTGKLKVISVSPEEAANFMHHDPNAQVCSETLGKNIAIRRISTDFIISTSIEDICPLREDMEHLDKEDVFYIGARRATPLDFVKQMGNYVDFPEVQKRLKECQFDFEQVGDSGAYPGDIWSLITCCGDFQFASKKLWHELKGFEEFLIYRGFLDTNIQKKAVLAGHSVELHRELPVFHINHGGSFGGFGGINDMDRAIRNFTVSKNGSNWGFSDYDFKVEVV